LFLSHAKRRGSGNIDWRFFLHKWDDSDFFVNGDDGLDSVAGELFLVKDARTI
jgi:hypothetical protein